MAKNDLASLNKEIAELEAQLSEKRSQLENEREQQTREAYVLIDACKRAAEENLQQARQIADKFGVSFSWDFEYGMGGSYVPNEGWAPSSESC